MLLLPTLAGCMVDMPTLTEFETDSYSTLVLQPRDVGPPFDSPFGPFSRRAAFALCESPHVRIGSVVGIDTFYVDRICGNDIPCGRLLHSVVTLSDEAVLVGGTRGPEDFTVPGGTDGSLYAPVSNLFPQPEMGARFAVAYGRISNPNADPREYDDGTPLVGATFRVHVDGNLPRTPAISRSLQQFCEELPQVVRPATAP